MAPVTAVAESSAALDRKKIAAAESVRLFIETDQQNSERSPDIGPLSENFHVLGTSSGQNISVVNGKQSVIRRWTYELEPKITGVITLPAILVGAEQTEPIQLTVVPNDDISSTQERDVFIEVEVSDQSPYVQQQVDISIRLFLGVDLVDGSLSEPSHDNLAVVRLGNDTNTEAEVNDRRYRVIERRYSVFPQKSGTLTIPPVRFAGITRDSSQSSRRFIDSLFNQGTRIRSRSDPVTIDVRPPNPAFTGRTWLPAKKLQLDDLNRSGDTLELGQPLNRIIQVQALGLIADQLPDIFVPESGDYKAYSDQTESDTQQTEQGPLGIKRQSIAIIPTQAGSIQLPAYRINWWDIETDQQRTAELPPREILVTDSSLPVNEQQAPTPENKSVDAKPGVSETSNAQSKFWRNASVLLTVLWLLTLAVLVWQIRRHSKNRPESDTTKHTPNNQSAFRAQVLRACSSNNPHAARQALIDWFRSYTGKHDMTSLEDLSAFSRGHDLGSGIAHLDRTLFADDSLQWEGGDLAESFRNFESSLMNGHRSAPDDATSLYPVPLRNF
ncbi:MAG: BatD family protein [Pseudomonadota bacterium]